MRHFASKSRYCAYPAVFAINTDFKMIQRSSLHKTRRLWKASTNHSAKFYTYLHRDPLGSMPPSWSRSLRIFAVNYFRHHTNSRVWHFKSFGRIARLGMVKPLVAPLNPMRSPMEKSREAEGQPSERVYCGIRTELNVVIPTIHSCGNFLEIDRPRKSLFMAPTRDDTVFSWCVAKNCSCGVP